MVMPYLNFQGDCEEALNLYVEAFGGTIQHLVRYDGAPEDLANPLSPEMKHKVMHAQIQLTENGFLSAADAVWPVEAGSAVNIHVHLDSEAEARRIYGLLAENGGSALYPLTRNPPPDDDGLSGMVKDRFGFIWVLSAMADK